MLWPINSIPLAEFMKMEITRAFKAENSRFIKNKDWLH